MKYEYKKGDIVICSNKNPSNSFEKPYPNKSILYIIEEDQDVERIIVIITKGIPKTGKDWRVLSEDFKRATKEDLKEYLQFIFTNEKIWIKYSNSSEGNLLSKIINKKYPFKALTLPENIKKHDKFYFNRTMLFQNIIEEAHLKEGYSIIEFKDIKYIIQKINGKI